MSSPESSLMSPLTSPVAHLLFFASRYVVLMGTLDSHADVRDAIREVWHMVDTENRANLLLRWRNEIPPLLQDYRSDDYGDHAADVGQFGVQIVQEELVAWERLWAWCEEQPAAAL